MNDKKKVKNGWALTRVSSKEQGKVQHGSLEQQQNRIKRLSDQAYEETKCIYNVVKTISETKSGKKEKYHLRKGIEEVLQAIRTRSIDFIFIESVSRLGRWGRKNAELIETAAEQGVEVWFADGGIHNSNDKGDRIKFGINNLMAEEESKDNQERVTKKQREAMVNNGKDTSTVPTLGLDAHDRRVGMYVPNHVELKIVKDLMERFCELKSIKATKDYCNSKGYKTKTRITKGGVDEKGNIIPPRKMGDEDFDEQKLRVLLINPKYRGCNFFEDEYNQFPKLHDDKGFVKWEYSHYREFGPLIDISLLERVDATLKLFERHKPKIDSKYGNVYLLSGGVLRDHLGNHFHGGSAKGGQHLYYYNKAENQVDRKSLKKSEIEEIAVNRLKQYFRESGTLEKVMRSALKNRLVGIPLIEEEIPKLQQKIKELENIVIRFTDSIRNAALDPNGDLVKACAILSIEKEKAENDLKEKKAQLEELLLKKEQVLKRFEYQTLEGYLKRAMDKFDEKSDLQKKAMIQI